MELEPAETSVASAAVATTPPPQQPSSSRLLKGLLLDALGLITSPISNSGSAEPALSTAEPEDTNEHADAAGRAAAADDAADKGTAAAGGEDHSSSSTFNKHRASDEAFEARLATINQRYASDASAARDAQQFLQAAHRQARQKEAEVLAAADAAYTPAWRTTGLPSKASQLQLDASALSSGRLLNPAAIIQQQQAHQQVEVLQPPEVLAYCDRSAEPHYLQTTGNQRVRQGIAAARIAAVKLPKKQHAQPPSAAAALSPHSTSPSRSTTKPLPVVGTNATADGHQDTQQQQQQDSGSAAVVQSQHAAAAAGSGHVPWSALPPDQAAQKVAAAAARYKAMAAIMTPEQREAEEKIIASMYQRLVFLKNPRYATAPKQTVTGLPRAAGSLRGTSTSRRQQQLHLTQHGHHTRSAKHPVRSTTAAAAVSSPGDAGFCLVPTEGVLFDAYEPGGVYIKTLQLQNVGTVMRQLRLLPPASRYFQISFPRFPLESSALAPGMCAEVDVVFTPDSLGDYEDAFAVDTPSATAGGGGSLRFMVQLVGRRPHPELTLPPVLEVGAVLVGNSRQRTFEFVNKGGDGRFLVMSAQQWAATLQQHTAASNSQQRCDAGGGDSTDNSVSGSADAADTELKSGAAAPQLLLAAADPALLPWAAAGQPDGVDDEAIGSASATSGPFAISPACLDLPAGAAAQLSVAFSPTHPGPHAAEFVLVCDNCTAHPLRVEGAGERVQVELVGLDGRQWLPQDTTVPLWFGEVCPGASNVRRLRVCNNTNLPFPFSWSVTQQHPHQLVSAATASATPPAAFVVSPAAGVLQAKAEQEFTLSFSPTCLEVHSSVLELLVQRSGDGGLLSITQWGQEGTAIVDLAASSLSSNSSTRKAASSSAGGGAASEADSSAAVVNQDRHQVLPGQEGSLTSTAAACQDGGWPGDSPWQSVARVQVEGIGAPVTLTVQPTAVLRPPGALTVGDEAYTPLQVCNDTAAPAHFSIKPSAADAAAAGAAEVWLEPCWGVVPPHSALDLTAHFRAVAAGSCTRAFAVDVLHGQRQQMCAQAQVRQVVVVPSCPTLDFGVLCVGASATRTLELTNTAANSDSTWCLQQHGQQASVPPTVLACTPSTGVLGPSSSSTSAVTVTGRCEGAHRLLLRVSSSSSTACSCCSSDGSSSRQDSVAAAGVCSCSHEYVQVLVTVSSPKVALSKYRLPIEHAYTGVPQRHSLRMTNTSSLPLTFSWAVQQLTHRQYTQLQQSWQLSQGSAGQHAIATDPDSFKLAATTTQHEPSHSQQQQQQQQESGQIRIEISPSTGFLQPGQSLQLQLHLEPLAVGPVALLCCCRVPAMTQLVGCVLTAQVAGLQVRYDIMRPQEWQKQQQQQQRRRQQMLLQQEQQQQQGRRPGSRSKHQRAGSPVSLGHSRAASARATHGGHHRQHQQLQVVSPPGATTDSVRVLVGAVSSSAAAPAAAPAADFGRVCLHQPAELLLQVSNLTSIASTVRAWMGHFGAQQQTSHAAPGSFTSLQGHTQGAASTSLPLQDSPCRSTVQSAATSSNQQQQLGGLGSSDSRCGRSSSPCSQGRSRQLSPQHHRGQSALSAAQALPASSVAGKLRRTDPCTYSGRRVHSADTIPADALISTVSSISEQMSCSATLGAKTSSSCGDRGSSSSLGVSAATISTTTSSSCSGSGGGSLKGPFRAFAGNAMMAARQAAAAATAALGSSSAGCAVQLMPDSGMCQLPGWGSVVLRLQAFNNLPGSYVDTLFVQVGELPPQRIPMTLQVSGSPLVISNNRVQRPASEVLQCLLQQQGQHGQHEEVDGQQLGSSSSSTIAADGGSSSSSSSSSSGSASGSSGGCGAGGVLPTAAGPAMRPSGCRVDFGVVPAGLEVEQAFWVSNTGPLPVQLEWGWQAAPASSAATPSGFIISNYGTASNDNSGSGSLHGADLQRVSSSGGAACAHGMSATGADSRPDTATATCEGDKPRGAAASASAANNSSAAASSNLTKGNNSGPAAAGPAAGAKPQAAAAAAKAAGKGAVCATGGPAAAAAAGRRASATAADATDSTVALHQQQQESSAGAGPSTTAPAQAEGASDHAAEGSAGGEPPHATDAGGALDACAVLPPGGPSSLLSMLQQQRQPEGDKQQQKQPGASLPPPFTVQPAGCVIAPGQQQRFAVTFSTPPSDVAGWHDFVLQGRQSFVCAEAAAAASADEDAQTGSSCVRLHVWPTNCSSSAPASSAQMQQQQPEAALLRCQITGGFHPHAGPPPTPLPVLTANLRAKTVAPRLTPADSDPDTVFLWRCTTSYSSSSSNSRQYLQTATLCNDTGCPQAFALSLEGPFVLVAAVPSVMQDPDAFRGMMGSSSLTAKQLLAHSAAAGAVHPGQQQPASGTAVTGDAAAASSLQFLPPGESVVVTVRFEPPPVPAVPLLQPRAQAAADQATEAQRFAAAVLGDGSGHRTAVTAATAGAGSASTVDVPPEAATCAGGAAPAAVVGVGDAASSLPSVRYSGALKLLYTTGQEQVLPLGALVLQPQLVVPANSTVLDFGGVHAAAPRTLELLVTNPTEADAVWEARVAAPSLPLAATPATTKSGADATSGAAFSVLPHKGVLAGRGLGMPRSTRLQVVCAPGSGSSAQLAAELQLSVRGGATLRVQLRGEAVYAESAEARVAYDL